MNDNQKKAIDYSPYRLKGTVPYVLKSLYNEGGENVMTTLFYTNVDLSKLLKDDLRGFLHFFQSHIAEHVNFGNFDSDPEIFMVNRLQRKEDQALDDYIDDVIADTERNELDKMFADQCIEIIVNHVSPSTFYAFVQEDADNAHILNRYLKSKTVTI